MRHFQYKHYLLALLTTVAVFNYLDRTVLSLLLEPIKEDLELSDSELGFLTGFAFAMFYAVAGIPIARWADRSNRNTVITATTALWSVMVAVCGLVISYTQLLLVRVGVAVGEAGCVPPAQSLIADYFDRVERPRAMAVYWLCYPVSMILGYLGGGWLADSIGWRMTFVVIGVPGVLLAILVKLSLREPRLKKTETFVVEQPSLKIVLATLWQQRSFRQIVTAFCLASFFGVGVVQWLPTFFIRSHDMEISEVGLWFAFAWGVCGMFGTYLGGALATRYAANKEALQIRVLAALCVLSGLLYAMVFLSPNPYLAMGFMSIVAALFGMFNGPIFSMIQSLVIDCMRSVALALTFLFANLLGFGLGPVAVGILSDLLSPKFGHESLRYSLVLFAPGYFWLAFHYWQVGNTIEADIRRVELEVTNEEENLIMLSADERVVSNTKTDRI